MEKEKPFNCDTCGKRYKNLNGLKYVSVLMMFFLSFFLSFFVNVNADPIS